MKIIKTPKVYLIGQQKVNIENLKEFYKDENLQYYFPEDINSHSEALVELAGRIDYLSHNKRRPGGNFEYVANLLRMGHGSVTEMAIWQFYITNISRSTSKELFRHRTLSPSELSQRYVDLSDENNNIGVIEPDNIASDPELHELWQEAQIKSRQVYKQLCDKLYSKEINNKELTAKEKTDIRKLVRQAARSVLPEATETKIFISINARSARNMFELRCSRYAAVEIRKLTNIIYDILLKDSPNLFSDYKKVILPDETFELITEYKKV